MVKGAFKLGILGILMVFFSFPGVLAIDFLISSSPVQEVVVNDANQQALFDITLTNQGSSGDFEFFTYELFDISPREFSLEKDETRVIRVGFTPIDAMKKNTGHVSVSYFIREKAGSENQVAEVSIKLVNFDDAFDVSGENVNLDSNSLTVSFYNLEDFYYSEVNLVFSSEFFGTKNIALDLNPYEKRDFEVPIDESKFKKLVAGSYTITAVVTVNGRTTTIEGPVKILEKSGLGIQEFKSGIIIREYTIEKVNEGNVPTVATIDIRKNILSRLFTTLSLQPDRVERNGFYIDYAWQEELLPSESLRVNVTTNWIFPFLLLLAVIAIVFLFNVYVTTSLVLNKRVSFVRTKGGEFALRVTLNVRARKFMENVKIYDRLPAMSKLYEKFGTTPDHFNHTTGVMEWGIPRLAEGEERRFTYVIYSKLKVVGKFELPSATGIYEIEGKLHEAKSNRTFFINEPKDSEEIDL